MTEFSDFVSQAEAVLRRGLVARFGADTGRTAAVDVLSWAWPRWAKISGLENPTGYLYRVAVNQTKRRLVHRPARFPVIPYEAEPWVEPGLPTALAQLSSRQREVVVLVHGYGMSHSETAKLLGLKRSTIQNHLERGLKKLRAELGVHDHA